MAQLKINRNWKRPEWKDVIPKGKELSFYNYQKALGAKMLMTAGGIGTGTKIHKFILMAVETPEGLGIISAYSHCGSKRYNSYLRPFFDDDMSIITCEKCLGH